jgi:hypothetical protein
LTKNILLILIRLYFKYPDTTLPIKPNLSCGGKENGDFRDKMAELPKDGFWVVRPFCFGKEGMAENGLLYRGTLMKKEKP